MQNATAEAGAHCDLTPAQGPGVDTLHDPDQAANRTGTTPVLEKETASPQLTVASSRFSAERRYRAHQQQQRDIAAGYERSDL